MRRLTGLQLRRRSADGGTLGSGNAAGLTAAANRDLERTACRGCRWWGWCHGGCIDDALLEGVTPFAPTSLRAGLRMYFDAVFGGGATAGEGGEDRGGGPGGQGAGCAA